MELRRIVSLIKNLFILAAISIIRQSTYNVKNAAVIYIPIYVTDSNSC
jgi:hypothetical protein